MKDVFAARVITLGGLTILLMLGAIIWHLLRVVLPLARTPEVETQAVLHLPDNHHAIVVGDLDNNQPAWSVHDCRLTPYYLSDNKMFNKGGLSLETNCLESIKILTLDREQWLFRYSDDNHLTMEKLNVSQEGIETAFVGRHKLDTQLSEPKRPLNAQDWIVKANAKSISVAMKNMNGWRVFTFSQNSSSDDSSSLTPASLLDLQRSISIEAERIVLIPRYQQIVGFNASTLSFYDEMGVADAAYELDEPILNISTNESQRSIFVEMASGKLRKWLIKNENGAFTYKPSTLFDVKTPIVSSVHSPSEQSALFLTTKNELLFANTLTGEIIQRQQLAIDFLAATESVDWFGLYQNKLYIASGSTIFSWLFYNESSVTTQALFNQVWYEGYDQPGYIWQSTSSSNQTEAKFSLVPLIIGSLKSALLAMVVAIPLALGAAVYTAFFSPDMVRNRLKPVVEFLEAIPSVVIGFVAAGWMATMTEETLLSFILAVLLLPVVLWLVALVQYRFAQRLPKQWQRGAEWLAIAIILIVLGLLIELGISSFSHGFASLAAEAFGESHWNKSTLVVALALGIAIVPTIYSIAEDAIYEVPIYLRQASFALGATQLQTLQKVVLVAAFPSIVSAIILGFSRAFGETILVLMITGNTPIADWDLLVGLRSMTANLAIELPEAEVNSTHYRILFLTALILFVFTFVINTLAEWVRGNVRRRYRYA